MPTPTDIPIFPLNTVLVPGGYLPLRIFEQRYLDMVRDASRDGSGFGVCLVSRDDGVEGLASHARVGTVAQIRDFYTMDDGLLGITAQGHGRFRIENTRVRDNGLIIGEISWLDEPISPELPAEYELLSKIAENFMEKLGGNYPGFEQEQLQNSSWVGYRLAELLPLESDEKQFLLELDDPIQRLQSLVDFLPRFQDGDEGE